MKIAFRKAGGIFVSGIKRSKCLAGMFNIIRVSKLLPFLAIHFLYGIAQHVAKGFVYIESSIGECNGLSDNGMLPNILKFVFAFPQCLFCLFTIRHIADGSSDQHSVLGLDRAETDLNRKFRAVLTQAMQVKSQSHGTHAWFRKEACPTRRMSFAKAFRHDELGFLSEDLTTCITEHAFGLGVDHFNDSLRIYNDHCIWCGIQQAAKFLLCRVALFELDQPRLSLMAHLIQVLEQT